MAPVGVLRWAPLITWVGPANFPVVMGLPSLAGVLAAEQDRQDQVPGIAIRRPVVSLRPVKGLDRVLDAQGRPGKHFVVPEIHLP